MYKALSDIQEDTRINSAQVLLNSAPSPYRRGGIHFDHSGMSLYIGVAGAMFYVVLGLSLLR